MTRVSKMERTVAMRFKRILSISSFSTRASKYSISLFCSFSRIVAALWNCLNLSSVENEVSDCG